MCSNDSGQEVTGRWPQEVTGRWRQEVTGRWLLTHLYKFSEGSADTIQTTEELRMPSLFSSATVCCHKALVEAVIFLAMKPTPGYRSQNQKVCFFFQVKQINSQTNNIFPIFKVEQHIKALASRRATYFKFKCDIMWRS